jgi:hypothetical protein
MTTTIRVDASMCKYRAVWVATSAEFPRLIAEGRTVEELRQQFGEALERANLPSDSALEVRFHYDHGTRAAILSVPMNGVSEEATTSEGG